MGHTQPIFFLHGRLSKVNDPDASSSQALAWRGPRRNFLGPRGLEWARGKDGGSEVAAPGSVRAKPRSQQPKSKEITKCNGLALCI